MTKTWEEKVKQISIVLGILLSCNVSGYFTCKASNNHESFAFKEFQGEDEQEQALRRSIEQGLGLNIDQAMNAYVLLNKKIGTGQIKNSSLLDLRDMIRAPEALVTGPIRTPKTTLLERNIKALDNVETVQEQELRQALINLKENYITFLNTLQRAIPDALIDLREYKPRLSLEGELSFYRMKPSVDLLNLSKQAGAAHAFGEHEGVFYKAHAWNPPLSPGQEYAVCALYRLLNIDIPATLLLSVDSDEKVGDEGVWMHRMIQASARVEGEGFDQTLKKSIPIIANYSQQFVGALLSLPRDGKANNYIYNTETKLLTPIDNDLSFGSLVRQGYLNHKSILFCLKEYMDQPFDQDYATFLKKQDAGLILLKWLGRLDKKNEAYNELFFLNKPLERFEDLRLWDGRGKLDHLENCRKERENKRKKREQQPEGAPEQTNGERRYFTEEDYKELSLPIQMSWYEVEGMYKRFITLQQALRDKQDITYAQTLEQCMPLTSALYQHGLQQELSPLERYELVEKSSLTKISHIRIQNQSIIDIFQQEQEAFTKENELLSPLSLTGRLLSTLYNEREHIPSLQALETTYNYFPSLLPSLFKQGIPQGYLEQLIKEHISSPLLKILLKVQPQTIRQNVHLLNTAFDYNYHDIVEVLVEEGIHVFSTESAYRYWQTLRDQTQKEALKIFETLIPNAPELEWKITLEKMFPDIVQSSERFIKKFSFITGDHLKHRCLSSDQLEWLFNQHDQLIKRNRTGRSDVSWWPQKNPQVYFKKRPELPGYEYAATSFMRLFGIKDVPYSELMAFYNDQEGHYPVLATQAVMGDLVKDIWGDDTVFHHLDPEHTQLMILSAFMLIVEDGKEDNYILTPDQKRIIPIDSDHAFMPGSIQVEEKGWIWLFTTVSDKLQAKSLLFCLQEMNNHFTEKVRKYIQELDIDAFLQGWLEELKDVNDRYQGFFLNAGQLFNHPSPTILRIPLSSTFIEGLYHKLYTLKGLMSNPTITPLEMLLHMEPYVGKQYEKAFKDEKNKTVKDRFLGVTQGLYQKSQNGDRLSALNSREMMKIIHISDQELIGEACKVTTGPLAALDTIKKLQEEREFLKKIQAQLLNGSSSQVPLLVDKKRIIIDLEGKSSQEQSQLLSNLLQSNNFNQLLFLHNSRVLSDANLQSSSIQERLKLLRCLDLRGCTSLTEKSFQLIYTNSSLLEYLNVSGWSQLRNLKFPQCHYALKRLVVQNCPDLKSINLNLPALIMLEASNNSMLQNLKVGSEVLNYVDIRNSYSLKHKDVSSLLGEGPRSNFNFEADLFGVGLRYVDGRGVTRDFKNALEYLLLAGIRKEEMAIGINQENRIFLQKETYGININQNEINPDNFKEFFFTPTSTTLKLAHISPHEVRLLAHGNLPELTILNLEGHWIGDKGVKILKEGTLTNLKSLNLRDNEIGPKGAEHLSFSTILTNLTSLDLSNNNIGNKGAIKLGEGNLTELTSLILSDNHIENNGIKAIREGLPKCKDIKWR